MTARMTVLLIALVSGCSLPAPSTPAPASTPMPSIGVVVITGVDETHTIITEPLEQVYPSNAKVEWPRVAISFRDVEPFMFGIEGAVPFFKATYANGSVVVDHEVEWYGSVVLIPHGSFTFTAYYRGCDANCGMLTRPIELCSASGTLADESDYWLTVRVVSGRCDFRET